MSPTSDTPVVRLRGVSFSYPGPESAGPALEDVDLDVMPGDFVGLIGPNGGGKTTLLRIILGLLEPDAGTVEVLGRPPREVSRWIGYVPQQSRLDPDAPATVLDVALMGRLGASPWGFRHAKGDVRLAREALDRMEVLPLERRRVGELSGGQRQRVLIARALASQARILLLDEPLAGVDLHMEAGILEVLQGLLSEMPVLLVSHDVSFVTAHVKRVACLNVHMVVSEPGTITRSVIAEMYGSRGPVRALEHRAGCPTSLDLPATAPRGDAEHRR